MKKLPIIALGLFFALGSSLAIAQGAGGGGGSGAGGAGAGAGGAGAGGAGAGGAGAGGAGAGAGAGGAGSGSAGGGGDPALDIATQGAPRKPGTGPLPKDR